jgi:hypothetical protein
VRVECADGNHEQPGMSDLGWSLADLDPHLRHFREVVAEAVGWTFEPRTKPCLVIRDRVESESSPSPYSLAQQEGPA